jgi:hypothetical protein
MIKLRVCFHPLKLLHLIDFPSVLVKFFKITFQGNYIPILKSSEYFPNCGGQIPAITARTESIKLRRGIADMHRLSARQTKTHNPLSHRLDEGVQ